MYGFVGDREKTKGGTLLLLPVSDKLLFIIISIMLSPFRHLTLIVEAVLRRRE